MDQPGKITKPAGGQLNRENEVSLQMHPWWLQAMNISLSPFKPENLVSRDRLGSPVSRQPAHLHTQAESGAYFVPGRHLRLISDQNLDIRFRPQVLSSLSCTKYRAERWRFAEKWNPYFSATIFQEAIVWGWNRPYFINRAESLDRGTKTSPLFQSFPAFDRALENGKWYNWRGFHRGN